MKFGTDEQKDYFLPKMATGEIRAAFSLSEPEVGSDVQGIKATAKKADDGNWELNGQKMWVTNGLGSAVVFVLMKNDPKADPPYKGMTCFITEKEPWAETNEGDFEGLEIPPKIKKMGYKGVESTELVYDGYRRPETDPRRRGGRPGQGLHSDDGRARGRARERRRPRRRHRPAGARAGAALQPGAEDLRQADRPAPGDPVQARRHGDQGRGRPPDHPQGGPDEGRRRALDLEAGMAKLLASETGKEVVEESFRIHGGYGYSKEYEIERLYRDAPLLLIGEGTSEIQRMVIGKKLLERNKI